MWKGTDGCVPAGNLISNLSFDFQFSGIISRGKKVCKIFENSNTPLTVYFYEHR